MVTSIAASSLSSPISRRAGEPGPTAAQLTAPGLNLASLTSSPTVLAPSFGPTTRTSGPRAVVDEESLSQRFAEVRREEPRADVGKPARRVRNDDPHRLARVGLRAH